MLTIHLYSIGKNKESWVTKALSLYQTRLKKQVELKFNWLKTNEQLIKALQKESLVIAFDPKGEELCSRGFATALSQSLEKNGSQLALVIGGFGGLPPELKQHRLISFSKMIFTHQLSRIIVAEQIYRAVQIWNNSPYHFS